MQLGTLYYQFGSLMPHQQRKTLYVNLTHPNTYIFVDPQVMGWKVATKVSVKDMNPRIYIIRPRLSFFLPQVGDI